MRFLARFAWVVLAYNGAVILWGAFVRATGSGAGCGSHWPACNGEVVPRAASLETVIELTHRLTSGLALVLVVALVVLAFRAAPAGHRIRRAAVWSLVFILIEAAIGAGLVLFEWVAGDKSLGRGIAMGAHLVNTLLLLAELALVARFAGDELHPADPVRAPRLGRLLGIAIGCMFVTAATGGIAALGDTLFPARSIAHGLAQDLSSTSHAFLRLRTFHPFLAAGTGLLLVTIAMRVLRQRGASTRARTTAAVLVALVATQVTVGALDILLLAPIPLQLVHLALADALWVVFVLLAADLRGEPVAGQVTKIVA